MNTLKIDILNPKVKKLLQDLADLNLIIIRDKSENEFAALLKHLRRKSKSVPDMEEIIKEVETVRSKRHAQ